MTTRILLVDDHAITREGIHAMLSSDPQFQIVGHASNGREAVELASSIHPDIVVMDITMPLLNGIDATRQLKATLPDARILILSMHGERQFVTEALAAGASGYLLKDCPACELDSALHAIARGATYLSPSVQAAVVHGCINGMSGTARGYGQNLSPREREVLQLVAEGKSMKAIARCLHLSVKTIETHRRQVMAKLDIDNIAGLTRYAIREGMTTLQ